MYLFIYVFMYVRIYLFIHSFIYSGQNSLAWCLKVKPITSFAVVGQLRETKVYSYILYMKDYRLRADC
jgi:hypothetical protein